MTVRKSTIIAAAKNSNSNDKGDTVTLSFGSDTPSGKEQKSVHKAILNNLEELGGKLTTEEDIVFSGTKIVLPANLSIAQAMQFLANKQEADEKVTSYSRTFQYRPWDGARATYLALKKAFGMVTQVPTWGFFGPNPPQLIDIPISATAKEQVPWGAMMVPFLPGAEFTVGQTHNPELGWLFFMHAEAPRKDRFAVEGIFNLIEEELRTNSLYRGKAFDGQDMPEFLDLSGVDPAKVIYSEEVLSQLDANVWSLLKYSDQMRDLDIPLKRAVLFEGPYGTGKTLGAYLTAKIAAENGWTFVYCRPGRDSFSDVVQTARLYQPAIVFIEDVDVIADSSNTDTDHVSEMLDIFDGLQSKNTEVLCVLTTNHVERIHKGMVRPGRLDAVIHIGELDDGGIVRLVNSIVPSNMLDAEIQWDKVCAAMEGYLPAFVKEAVDRSVRYSLARNAGQTSILTTDDLVHAANGLRPQLDLMAGAKDQAERLPLAIALGGAVQEAVAGMTWEYNSDNDTYKPVINKV